MKERREDNQKSKKQNSVIFSPSLSSIGITMTAWRVILAAASRAARSSSTTQRTAAAGTCAAATAAATAASLAHRGGSVAQGLSGSHRGLYAAAVCAAAVASLGKC